MAAAPSIVAVFDFDNTLTDRDSLLPFLFYLEGWKAPFYLASLSLFFAGYLTGMISRQEMKEKILKRFMRGRPFAEVEALGETYARDRLDSYLKLEALHRLKWHQEQGHRCLIVSASLEFYLKPWAEQHGFETVLGSRLELTSDGKITGYLEGSNCWGPEKERRLLAYLGPKENFQLYAYGDSRGDRELLEMADCPFYRKF